MNLTREEILGADDINHVDLDVAEWGGSVRVGTMAGCSRDYWELFLLNSRDDNDKLRAANIRATLVALTVVDDDGELLFTVADIVALGKKSAVALDRVYAAAKKLNRLSDKDVEEVAKNSDGDPSDDSGS